MRGSQEERRWSHKPVIVGPNPTPAPKSGEITEDESMGKPTRSPKRRRSTEIPAARATGRMPLVAVGKRIESGMAFGGISHEKGASPHAARRAATKCLARKLSQKSSVASRLPVNAGRNGDEKPSTTASCGMAQRERANGKVGKGNGNSTGNRTDQRHRRSNH